MSYTIKSISSSDSNKKKSITEINKKTTYIAYGFFGVLLLIILSLFFSFSGGRDYQAFVDSLNRNDFSKAQIQLKSLESVIDSKYSKYANNDMNSVETRIKNINNLVKALDIFSNPDAVNSIQAVRNIKQFTKHLAAIGSSGLSSEGNRYRRNLMESYNILVINYKKLRKQEIITPIIQKENQDRVYQQSILAQDLATEFGLLLGIAPEQLKGPSDRTKFYQGGVLQGLPVLRRLPDNIPDLPALKVAIKSAQGNVSLRGDEKTPERFMAKLEELRVKCAVFAGQINQLENSTGNKQEEIKKLTKQFDLHKNRFLKNSKLFLIEYLK